jgi:hypothetical protein
MEAERNGSGQPEAAPCCRLMRKRPVLRKVAKWTAIVLVALIALTAIFAGCWSFRASGRLQRALDETRSRG